MLELTLIRHAKSSWDYPELTDQLRPLNKRGYRQGKKLAEGFPENVDEIWCSPAVRAYTTARYLLLSRPELGERIRLREQLYAASTETLFAELARGTGLKHIALIGHNPELDLMASILTDSEVSLKTAHIARLEVNCESWQELKPGCARLISLWRPED